MQKNKSEHEKQQLKLIIEKLRNENTYLKNATSFIFTPTKEAQMFMEQNKLKVMQQKNLKQNNQPYLDNSVPVSSQDLINGNNNPVFENNSNEDANLTNFINESLLSGSSPELINEIYKILNMQNQELANYSDGSDQPPKDNTIQIPNVHTNDPSFNPALMTPNSLLSTSSPNINSELVSNTTNQELLSAINNSSQSNDIYNILSPLHNVNQTTVPSNQNILIMNEQNPHKNLEQTILNQQLVNAQNSNNAALPNTAIDQNSLLTVSLFNNNIPATVQQPHLTPPEIQNMNSLYTLNPMISGSMNYRTETVNEDSQPMNDEFFNNMVQLINDEDYQLKQQYIKHTEPIPAPVVGIPSPSSIVCYGKENPSTPDNGTLPEDFDSESIKSGEIEVYAHRSLPENEIPDVDENSNNESTSREAKVEDNKRNNSTHSTLQFPTKQEPTKILIPYSVFPRVTQETVDNFINDAKLSEEELECLCSELKNKATCKEKLKYISNNIEIPGWTIEKWQKGRIKKEKGNENENENECEEEKENNENNECNQSEEIKMDN